MRELLTAVIERSLRYIDSLPQRRVFPSAAAVERLEQFYEPFPDAPTDPETVISFLDEIGAGATVATTGGRYFGFVTGGSLPAAMAAKAFHHGQQLRATWNVALQQYYESPKNIAVEYVSACTLAWSYFAIQPQM